LKADFSGRRLLVGLAILCGAALRILGARGGLWLDEIWSVALSRQAVSPIEILRMPFDNNHPLNTLFLRVVGETRHDFLYRLLSLACGLGTLFLMSRLSERILSRGRAVLAVWLVAVSYPLVVYDSEARGYAPAVFFAVLSLLLLDRWQKGARTGDLLLFNASLVLGFLSHLTFLFVFASLAVDSIGWCVGQRRSLRASARLLSQLFLLPALLILLLGHSLLSGLQYAGGPRTSALPALRDVLLSLAGIPPGAAYGFAPAIFVLLALGGMAAARLRAGGSHALFFAAMLLAPPAVVALRHTSLLYVRYFLVCFPFALLLLADFLGELFARGRAGRAAAVTLAAGILLGNGEKLVRFLEFGRGGAREAVRDLAARSRGSLISISSDHDFRNGLVLEYEARDLPPGRSLTYVRLNDMPPEGAEWFVRHSYEREPHAPRKLLIRGAPYTLERIYPFSGELSGFHWFLYRRAQAPQSLGP
jgi:hypothetical protein